MIWGDSISPGDWVKASHNLSIGMCGGTSVKAGTRGVVTSIAPGWWSSRASVAFDGGFGTVTATVPTQHLMVVRRGGGFDRFTARQGRLTAVRAALALYLTWPVIWWIVQYVWINRSVDEILGSFALGVVESVVDWIAMLIEHPLRGLLYLVFLTILSKFAWR